LTEILIIGIVAVALLVADHVWSSLQFRRALRETSLVTEQTLIVMDRVQERSALQISELLDRLMATDFQAYKEQKEIELSEGFFEPPDEPETEEGGIERPGAFPHTPREEDIQDTMVREEAAILAEDFDEVGNPR